MSFFDKFDKHKCTELLIGIIGINITFVTAGVFFEWMTKQQYTNIENGQKHQFRSSSGLIEIERGIVWLLAEVWNHFTIPKQNAVKLPTKNLAICGFIIFFSSISNTQALYLVSFPLTIMVKSCNILSVILVGVLCSRVQNKQLKLGGKKIVVAIVVTIGIIMYRYYDPELELSNDKDQRTQLFGLALLLLSLLADGFLPDFQAQVKQKYKPGPTQMMLQINKWSFIFCFIYSIILNQLLYTLSFCWYYPLFTFHLISMSILTFLGQIFVYRMIKEFKQHIVPFVVTTRKVITVGFSLIFFKHSTRAKQIFGIILIFAITLYEFLTEMLKTNIPPPQQLPRSNVQIDNSLQQAEHEFEEESVQKIEEK